ncbi:MAG TPA: hypothetical protein VMU30_02330 [Bacteroidota bacterium]|nr:hypothetical protein [Bacteroidota bacterium]
MPSAGFIAYSSFIKQAKRLAQLYDFTIHLYNQETPRLERILKTALPHQTIQTSLGTISHGVQGLYQMATVGGPNRLRSLILVSLVTQLEVFLTELISEIALRDLTPFIGPESIELPQARIFMAPSIDTLRDDLISREARRLTSGGLSDIVKYYRKRFNIEFAAIFKDFSKIEEMHDRRHLHVHANGEADGQYIHKHPASVVSLGDVLTVDHTYILDAFRLSREFASALATILTNRFPNRSRFEPPAFGKASSRPSNDPFFILQLELLNSNLANNASLMSLVLPKNGDYSGGTLDDITVKLILRDHSAIIILQTTQAIFSGFMGALKLNREISIRWATII